MVDKLIITKNGIFEENFTSEEINQRLTEQMEVKEEYPNISEQEETIALLVIENENLKSEIENIKNKLGGI